MKLRTQIAAFGAAGALLVIVAGSIGLVSSSRLSHNIDEAVQVS